MKKTQTLKQQQQQKTNHHGFLVMKTIVLLKYNTMYLFF